MKPDTVTIHVALLNEGTNCWRPVQALPVEDDLFKIVDVVPAGEHWEFQPERIVRCQQHEFSDGTGLLAVEAL